MPSILSPLLGSAFLKPELTILDAELLQTKTKTFQISEHTESLFLNLQAERKRAKNIYSLSKLYISFN